jgi:flagellar motor component MotA
MKHEEFVKEYEETLERALSYAVMARTQGLLSLESCINQTKYKERDVFELGLRLVCDGTDGELIYDILSNIIDTETDPEKKILGKIKREAIMRIRNGMGKEYLALLLNSYVNFGFEEALKIYKEY